MPGDHERRARPHVREKHQMPVPPGAPRPVLRRATATAMPLAREPLFALRSAAFHTLMLLHPEPADAHSLSPNHSVFSQPLLECGGSTPLFSVLLSQPGGGRARKTASLHPPAARLLAPKPPPET
jgi:hypothetical protein